MTEFLTTARYNGTAAYTSVYGVTGHSAEVGASRLRKRPDVAAEIRVRFRAQMEALQRPVGGVNIDELGADVGAVGLVPLQATARARVAVSQIRVVGTG